MAEGVTAHGSDRGTSSLSIRFERQGRARALVERDHIVALGRQRSALAAGSSSVDSFCKQDGDKGVSAYMAPRSIHRMRVHIKCTKYTKNINI